MNSRVYSRPKRRSHCRLSVSWLLMMAAGGVWLSGCSNMQRQPPAAQPASSRTAGTTATAAKGAEGPSQTVEYRIYELPTSVMHVVTVPPESGRRVTVAWSENLATLATLAESAGAIAAINAGFFDPQNGLTTSYITQGGAIAADPQQNPRLMDNPELQAYLPAILNRSEFRIYDCDDGVQYDIAPHATPTPATCTLDSAVAAGPQLLPQMTGDEEGFLASNASGEIVRDALGSQVANARSAVGIKADGTVVLAIATQLPEAESPTGLTLPAMAAFLDGLGVQKALNLDGGSSTGLYFQGQTYLGRLDDAGTPIERPIKSGLVIQ